MVATIRGQPFDAATRVEGMKRAAGDVLAAVDHLTRDTTSGIDAQRIAIAGYSAGGSVAVLTAAGSDRFRGVITEAPSSVGWSQEPARRDAVISAARCPNDGGTSASLIVYPKFVPQQPSTNPQIAAGHMLFSRDDGLAVWEKNVLAFLEKSLHARPSEPGPDSARR